MIRTQYLQTLATDSTDTEEVYVRDIVEEAISVSEPIQIRGQSWTHRLKVWILKVCKFFTLLAFCSAVLFASMLLFREFLSEGRPDNVKALYLVAALITVSFHSCCLVFFLAPIFRMKRIIKKTI